MMKSSLFSVAGRTVIYNANKEYNNLNSYRIDLQLLFIIVFQPSCRLNYSFPIRPTMIFTNVYISTKFSVSCLKWPLLLKTQLGLLRTIRKFYKIHYGLIFIYVLCTRMVQS